jgi:zinc protease
MQLIFLLGFLPCSTSLSVATPAFAIDVRSFNLAKGEQVWYVSDHTLPMIAITAALPAGSGYDPKLKPGLAALAAALLDQGAGKLNADSFQTALANRAIRLAVTPTRDWLIISLVTLTDNARDAFQLLGLALSQPRFDADAISRVRTQILSRLAQDEARPDQIVADAFHRAFFHDHPYAHPIFGDAAAVSAIGVTDLKRFAATHWVGGGLKIAASGDFDQETLAALLKAAFGRLPVKNPPVLALAAHEGDPGTHVVPVSGRQAVAVFGFPGVLANDREFIPALLANTILGDGPSSRLGGETRDGNELIYGSSSGLVADRKMGFVQGKLSTPRTEMQKAIEKLRAALQDYTQSGPSQTELDNAKAYLTGSFALSFDSNVAIASHLNEIERAGFGSDFVNGRNALISAVSLEDVTRVARRLFNPRRLTLVIGESLNEQPSPAKPLASDPPPR